MKYKVGDVVKVKSKRDEDLYYIHGLDSYCDEKYIKDCSEEDIELVLGKGEYCLKV